MGTPCPLGSPTDDKQVNVLAKQGLHSATPNTCGMLQLVSYPRSKEANEMPLILLHDP